MVEVVLRFQVSGRGEGKERTVKKFSSPKIPVLFHGKELQVMGGGSGINNGNVGGGRTYNPPAFKELQQQN
ncbi:hypothetical protein Ccrd_004210 [Cynara cardunculus var. scolymus]|uniref:Uncharacterized protein n=1 Tax=Cynara cardunculus var. scolymus TaxID=59895 RepID=A0A103XN12_CYNCS|nr:hypothetical protein Ccrd_004210 [Cynara cardunculus var. scolymus]